MKSKVTKIQKILMKGLAALTTSIIFISPIAYATTSLDDGYLDGSWWDKILYGEVGSTSKEIEEYLKEHTTLYITNEIQLRALAEYVNNGGNTVGKQIKLLNDIQVNPKEEWTPIGTENAPFKGVFDGMGYTIKGIVFNKVNKSYAQMTNIGLFGYVKKDTKYQTAIRNIILSDTNINIYEETDAFTRDTYDKQTYANLGGIVGYNDGATIENCKTTKDVIIKGAREVGGIVGYNYQGTIKKCSNQAIVIGIQSVGGIAGANIGDNSVSSKSTSLNFAGEKVAKIINCTNEGNIQTLVSAVGGITGVQSYSSIIQKCVNHGKIAMIDLNLDILNNEKPNNIIRQNVGGIVGWTTGAASKDFTEQYYTAVDGCINFGDISGEQDIGGIVGQLAGQPSAIGDMSGGYAILSNSINYSMNVKANITDTDYCQVGFLAGEVGVKGTSTGILYNNLYTLKTDIEYLRRAYDFLMNNKSSTIGLGETESLSDGVTLGYGEANSESIYEKFNDKTGNTTNIINIDKDGEYLINGPISIDVAYEEDATEVYEEEYKQTKMKDYNLSKAKTEAGYKGNDISETPVMFMYYPIATEANSNQTIIINNKKVNVDKSSILYEYDEKLKGFNLVDTDKTEDVIDSKTNTKVEYTITKNGDKTPIRENAYFKEGDTITITAKFNKYLTSGWGSAEPLIEAPTLTLVGEDNKKIELTNGNVTGKKYSSTEITYQYVVQEGDNVDITKLKLSKVGTIYVLSSASEHTSFSGISKETNIFNLHIDTVAPLIDTKVYVENALETGRYTAGKEILIEVKTNEPINEDYESMEIQVNFSESGIGKYNYTQNAGMAATVGHAKCKDARINLDGTTTWVYLYQIQEGDEGDIQLIYKAGKITDLAGNETDIKELYTPQNSAGSAVSGNSWNNELSVTYEFYKNSVSEANKITANTYFTKDDDLIAVATFNKVLYVHYGLSDGKNTNVRLTNKYKDRVPSLYLNGDSKLKNTSATVLEKDNSTIINYTFDIKSYGLNTLTNIEKVILKNENNTEVVSTNGTTATTNGLIPFAEKWYATYKSEDESKYKTVSSNAINTTNDINHIILDPIGVSDNIEQSDIYADTTAPTVEIIAQGVENNITNADEIKYTFTWSEELAKEEGRTFEPTDITVNNGTKGELVQDKNDPKVYTMLVKTNVANGSVGDLQVIVEKGACQDLVGHENVRTESIIKVDKQAPILIGLEAYGTSDIKVSPDVDSIKQYYKAGETVTIVATFTENIKEKTTTVPTLALQFSESGNAKGTVNPGTIEGNKITYTYLITAEDMGLLSVKGFTGKVIDAAGNETVVTKRALDGDTIIADTTVPTLNELSVVTPEGTYKAGTTISVEAIYSEEVYGLENNEIKNLTSTIVPTLKFKFGNGQEREAVAAGYGTKEDGTSDKTKIIYKCTIIDGDNGDYSITSYQNKESVKVCDIAGNEAALNRNQTGNKVTADTIRPQVTNITASVENPTIANTGIYHKEGNNIKITLTFDEKVSSAKLLPKILVGFSETEAKEPASYNEYSYESDWNVNSTTIEYTYTIKSGDNGYLWVKVPEGQFKDIAGNTNIAKTATRIANVFADTTAPTVTLLRDTTVEQDNQKITIKAQFSENVYDLNNNSRVTLTKDNAPKLIYSFGIGTTNKEVKGSVSGSVITYVIEKDPVNDNGTLYYELAKGNLCDRAGNEYYQETTDTTAPELERVYISNNGTHGVYCKKDVNMYITAVFSEEIANANMKLKVELGKGGEQELTGKINEANKKEVIFTYTVKENDNGKLTIIDVVGNTADDEALEDKTYGYVKDAVGNQKNIFNLNGVRIDGEAIADTIKPYITKISANDRNEEIASYQVTENGVETKIGKTNVETIEYIITFSEAVTGFTKEDITLANGTIKEFEPIINTNGTQYKLTVYNTLEGVQSLIIPENSCEDLAGNENTGARLNGVIIDFTPATVRFISEYNGGTYVLPTNIGKVEIRPNVEINEDISKIEYKWDEEEYTTIENISSTSDITIPTKAFTESGTHTLFIKVVDIAGNVTEVSKRYEIVNSDITITPSTTEDTKEDIKVIVNFGESLTDNRKVTFKAKDSNEVIELNVSGNSENGTEYTITENGTIYAEATDRVGGKVYTEYTVYNIDKEAPEIEFNYITTEVLTNVSVDTTISTNEDSKISYKWDNEEWQTTSEYTMNVKVDTKFAEPGEHILYAKAVDKCGNETSEYSLRFYVSAISFEVYGNPENWTNKDVELQVNCDEELASIKVIKGEQEITVDEHQTCVITENGDYVFTVTDKNGNTAEKTIKVSKIDKKAPVITSATSKGKVITINSTDAESGVAKYAITSTTEVPVEWSNSNVISTTKDGTYYVWAIDNVGNVVRAEEAITIDTTAPIITYRYTSLTSILGKLLESDIITNEDAVIFYSWDNQNWTSSEKYVTNVKASIQAENVGTYTLYVKAKDKFGNESDVQTLEFTVTKPTEEMKNSEIIFEDLPTIQVDGVKYVKVAADMTTKDITAKMNKDMLLGETPEYTELTKDNKLKTGSKITIKGETQYIIVVNGDVNCDGKVTPIDVTMANSIRLNKINSNIIQKLASDFDLNGKIGAIDITMINSYRLGKIKGI